MPNKDDKTNKYIICIIIMAIIISLMFIYIMNHDCDCSNERAKIKVMCLDDFMNAGISAFEVDNYILIDCRDLMKEVK